MMLRILVSVSVALVITSAGGQADATEKNIVLFVTDDQSLTLGCYGDPIAHSPHLDALAGDGVRFNNAFATTASCSASRSVILSGLHNHKNGQYGHQHHFHKFAAYRDVISLSLPRVLSRQGYRTAHIGKYHVAPEEVFRFEKYLRGNARNPVQMAENCREFLGDSTDPRPYFLYFATADPHRGGGMDKTSPLKFPPDLFGNRPNRESYPGVEEVFFDENNVPVPAFLSDTLPTRAELAQYYQSCARVDRGLGRLIDILKQTGQYDKTLIVFTSDHGMAFAGAKTTVYEPGLRVPMIVRNPYVEQRGVQSDALISHVDITPSLLDFAGGLDAETGGPKHWLDPTAYWNERGLSPRENRAGGNQFRKYQGRSWLPLLTQPDQSPREAIFASHTFHEIQMYYPMRVIRDQKYKLIWNIAHQLDFPFASDLWAASSWQLQFQQGFDAEYGQKTVGQYIQRPRFELYDMAADPNESRNLAGLQAYADVLKEYQQKLRQMQIKLDDPWRIKWEYE